jgi:hypothetical protein
VGWVRWVDHPPYVLVRWTAKASAEVEIGFIRTDWLG